MHLDKMMQRTAPTEEWLRPGLGDERKISGGEPELSMEEKESTSLKGEKS